ncbi:fasciclin domain-containing protein [Dermatobacter hominis]|uniref:fasciclin domain-containing protein n=1 Tax=Dermatobacter hominis TaxID=2884263 RepID=UPI001D127391|nr:fasciclin domain-containing protein [Dermatobacter hominis]UDY34065.1 fasciclin domain-containing protein [Dermatobacter hominis]
MHSNTTASPSTPRRRSPRRRMVGAALGAVALLGLGAAACSSDDDASSKGDDTTTTTEASSGSSTTTADGASSGEMAMEPSGPACESVPADGAGSFSGMAQDPAATAASNNPALSTLVSAVTKANLVDTLNGAGPFTIFAPANSAFEKIPADTLNTVLADNAQLTDILTYHVIAGQQLSSQQLEEMGKATTVEGKELTFTKDGDSLKVNGEATGVCIDVPTANATVHIIDSVLMPPA